MKRREEDCLNEGEKNKYYFYYEGDALDVRKMALSFLFLAPCIYARASGERKRRERIKKGVERESRMLRNEPSFSSSAAFL